MHDAHVGPCVSQAALDLHEAAGVRGDDGVRAGTHDVRDLSLEDRSREVGLRDVVRPSASRSEEHTSELQSQSNLVCRLLLENTKMISSNSFMAGSFFYSRASAGGPQPRDGLRRAPLIP